VAAPACRCGAKRYNARFQTRVSPYAIHQHPRPHRRLPDHRGVVLKIWKTRSATDISLGMFALFSVGVLLWIVYGFSIGSLPVILANSITLALALAIIVFKLRFK
jgi:MtN3 and saliva related transmembrane protein